jgi:hypothetical protein
MAARSIFLCLVLSNKSCDAIPFIFSVSNALGGVLNITHVNRVHMGTYTCEGGILGLPRPAFSYQYRIGAHLGTYTSEGRHIRPTPRPAFSY